jgi:cytochrome P450
MDTQNAMVFGAGRFKCLGQVVAILELNKVVAELLRRYEWRVCDSRKPLAEEFNVGLWIQHRLWMRATKREPPLI